MFPVVCYSCDTDECSSIDKVWKLNLINIPAAGICINTTDLVSYNSHIDENRVFNIPLAEFVGYLLLLLNIPGPFILFQVSSSSNFLPCFNQFRIIIRSPCNR